MINYKSGLVETSIRISSNGIIGKTFFGKIRKVTEKPQAIYRWYHGETLPTIDTLTVLSRVLNRPLETLIVTKPMQN